MHINLIFSNFTGMIHNFLKNVLGKNDFQSLNVSTVLKIVLAAMDKFKNLARLMCFYRIEVKGELKWVNSLKGI